MKIFTSSFLSLILFVFIVASAQAQMMIALQQQDGVIATINSSRQFITTDFVTFSLANDQVFEKVSQMQGQNVHILFYQAADEKKCIDVRLATEPTFEITSSSVR